ncbi:hypothetical protein PTTG_06263 [Puccinia triticina 1-1 BBBD Race 1]|uniref:Uncharacterized protein n=1 Tax=Puccinia triticina (isolate 1-1 / race 1 (BBBD)) TaxID=630390 RepID=A0A180FYE6_PUCT1|nr:hypothetical protein PTTG_06263 [Puccinia triticina 1-1 BBBD Race 1]
MNLLEWKNVLTDNGLLPEYDDVLHGFQFGFDQGIPHHTLSDLECFTPENHASSEKARPKIEESILKELKAGRMFGPFSRDQMLQHFGFFRTNPLSAVVNSDGAIRPINDLSFPRNDPSVPSVNSFVDKSKFETTWDDFNCVSEFLLKRLAQSN